MGECFQCWLRAWRGGTAGLAFIILGLVGGGRLAAAPATGPADGPKVSAEAAKLLGEVREAYANLQGLEMEGTITVLARGLEEQPQKRTASFSAVYGAPVMFRHSLGDSLVLANTAQKLYLYRATNNDVVAAAPITERVAGDKLNANLRDMLEEQNPSLLLALVPDAEAELLRGATGATVGGGKGDIPGGARLVIERREDSCELLFDSKTHLLRQVRGDLSDGLRPDSLPAGAKVELLITYTRDEPVKEVSAGELAWLPPAESQAYRPAPEVEMGDGSDAARKLEGQPAPAFSLKDGENKPVSLADLKGSVVVLDFWALWCAPCRAALPHLDELSRRKAGAGVKVLAINEQDSPEAVTDFMKQGKLGLRALLDEDGAVGKVYMTDEVIPETVVIGKDGVVRKVIVGYGPGDDRVEKAVDNALAE